MRSRICSGDHLTSSQLQSGLAGALVLQPRVQLMILKDLTNQQDALYADMCPTVDQGIGTASCHQDKAVQEGE